MKLNHINIKNAKEHNLQSISLQIPKEKITVITGPSGSGKSSLAFDTIYAECHRRYVESLSSYARQFLDIMDKPDVEAIDGLSPAISIEQKTATRNPRSTVGTITEIYDYLRLLFARIGVPYCFRCGKKVRSFTNSQIIDQILQLPSQTKISILSPLIRGKKGEYSALLKNYQRQGYSRIRIDGEVYRLESPPELEKHKRHTIEIYLDRIVIKDDIKRRVADAVELATKLSGGLVNIENNSDNSSHLYNTNLGCIDCNVTIEEIEPRLFSFNTPHGACDKCSGLGYQEQFAEHLIIPDPSLSLSEGALNAHGMSSTEGWYYHRLESVARYYEFSLDTPFTQLSKKHQEIIFYGSKNTEIPFTYSHENSDYTYRRTFEGVINRLNRLYMQEKGIEHLHKYMIRKTCPVCDGQRLNIIARNIKLHNNSTSQSISQLCDLTINKLLKFFQNLNLSGNEQEIAHKIIKEIQSRLSFLANVGVGYLSLSRAGNTLSGGESQRIRLATQIGSALSGVIYVLDEPSIGLHPRDNSKLIQTLKNLRDIGNTILVVEHDEETILTADHIVDLGPKAGKQGGKIVATGTPKDITENPNSITGQYLSKALSIPSSHSDQSDPTKFLTLKTCSKHNLKDIDVSFPIGLFTCVTGVSGSGKSTLVMDLLYNTVLTNLVKKAKNQYQHVSGVNGIQHIDKVIHIDQAPIGRTPRSNPVTYTGIYGTIRELFSKLPESKVRGYKPGRFSFNVKGGRCESCSGDGIIRIEMHFMPDVYVKCPDCKGKRYNPETLEIYYKGKNISEVLAMTIDEAYDFFTHIPSLRNRLSVLKEVGLGYITLGQSATTLSGGEAQRIKLSRELVKRDTGKTLYILDEPTTGLHFDDIKKLIEVLWKLRNKGNTLCVIEHNLHVIRSSDYIIDLGPEGGSLGGEIVTTGTPNQLQNHSNSYTGKYLKSFNY